MDYHGLMTPPTNPYMTTNDIVRMIAWTEGFCAAMDYATTRINEQFVPGGEID